MLLLNLLTERVKLEMIYIHALYWLVHIEHDSCTVQSNTNQIVLSFEIE